MPAASPSYFEWTQDLQGFFWQLQEVNSKPESVMRRAFNDVHETMRKFHVYPRAAAYILAVGRVADATLVAVYSPGTSHSFCLASRRIVLHKQCVAENFYCA